MPHHLPLRQAKAILIGLLLTQALILVLPTGLSPLTPAFAEPGKHSDARGGPGNGSGADKDKGPGTDDSSGGGGTGGDGTGGDGTGGDGTGGTDPGTDPDTDAGTDPGTGTDPDPGTGGGTSPPPAPVTPPPPAPRPPAPPASEPPPARPEPPDAFLPDLDGFDPDAPTGTIPIAPAVLPRGLDYLAPYAEALFTLDRARASLAEAEATLAALRAMDDTARARAFPADGPRIDTATRQADLDRLKPYHDDHVRLSSLTPEQRAIVFPPKPDSTTRNDEASYQATLSRYARLAADYETLRDMDDSRLLALYPGGRDSSGYRGALADAEARRDQLATRIAALTARAETLRLGLIGPRDLLPAEAEYLAAYLDGAARGTARP